MYNQCVLICFVLEIGGIILNCVYRSNSSFLMHGFFYFVRYRLFSVYCTMCSSLLWMGLLAVSTLYCKMLHKCGDGQPHFLLFSMSSFTGNWFSTCKHVPTIIPYLRSTKTINTGLIRSKTMFSTFKAPTNICNTFQAPWKVHIQAYSVE